MADKDKDKREDKEEGEEDKKPSSDNSKLKNILILALAAVLLVTVSVGATLLVAGKGSSDDTEATADEEAAADVKNADDKKAKKGKKGKKDKKDKGKEKDGKEGTSATNYLPLDPPFVVNFEATTEARYLQVSMEVMARDPAAIEDVKKHMPAIRNSLVLLLSSQNYKTLSSLEGKEKIRASALSEIQKILQEQTGKPGVDAVYFTGFVLQ